MNVIERMKTNNLVRADSPEAMNGFRKWREIEEEWDYFIPMDANFTNLYIRRTIQEGRSNLIEPSHVLVFNLEYNSAAIVKADKMVEPVELEVIVKEKE